MKMLLCAATVTLLPLSVTAGAASATSATPAQRAATSKVVAFDPTGDVAGEFTGPNAAHLKDAADVTKVVYKVAKSGAAGAHGRSVQFTVRSGATVTDGHSHHHQRAITRFTVGKDEYKVSYGTSLTSVRFQTRTGDEAWMNATPSWLSGGAGGGEVNIIFPVRYFNRHVTRLTDITTRFFLTGDHVDGVKDVIAGQVTLSIR